MTAPLADQILDAIGEATTRRVLRRLLESQATQRELVGDLGCDQSTASRAIGALRPLGLVESTGTGRSVALAALHRDELLALLLAADRLAETVIADLAKGQAKRSMTTRRLAVRPAAPVSTKKGRPRGT